MHLVHREIAHDNKPTPAPLTIRPNTIVQNPLAKVWMSPPTVKTQAPINRVPLRPIISPTLPAAIEVTEDEDEHGKRT